MEWLEFKENILYETRNTRGLEYEYVAGEMRTYRLPRRVISLGTATNDKIIKIPNWYESRFETKEGIDSLFVEVISCAANVFAGNENITDILLPDNIREIEQGSFVGCKNLKRITISNRVKFIPEGTFVGCDSLEDIYYGGSEEDWKAINTLQKALDDKGTIQLGQQEKFEDVSIHGNEPLQKAHIHFNCRFYLGLGF
jgi:hypothetical protein